MFENLTERLQGVFAKITGRGKLSEADIDAAMREVRVALLEADVNLAVAKEFVAGVREKALGAEVMRSLTPGQTVVKIVLDGLTQLMGGGESKLAFGGRIPNVLMLVGLQGSGKTTAAAKLASMLRKQGRRPMLVACDVYRPAAIDQLEALGRELGIPVHRGEEGTDPVDIAKAGVKAAVADMRDTVLIDTAGRLHVDEAMMDEAARIKTAVKPDQVLMVVDAMTGQDAVTAAKAFAERVDFDGVIVSKLDGDARGGAALSVRSVTGKPIKFVGVSEKMDGLEPFHPDRMAQRILGMGDVVGLIEKAQETADAAASAEMEQRLRRNEFTLDDFLEQMQQLKKMGSLDDILGMIPGLGANRAALKDAKIDPKAMDRTAAIIQSMTAKERAKPALINGQRRERIAAGSGMSVTDVNRLLKDFAQAKKMVQQMSKQKGRFRGGMPGFGQGM
jgi:signal recognition particle subunit SRP54